MIIALRHGHTAAPNAQHSPTGQVVNGGDKSVDLDAQGVQEVQEAALQICEYPVLEVRAAMAYKRDASSGHIVSQVCGVPLKDMPSLAPWDSGALTGQPLEAVWDVLSILMDIPTVAAPGGQAVGDWAAKWAQTFEQVYAEYGKDDSRAVVLIVHGMEMRALPPLTGDGEFDKSQQQNVGPGDFVIIH